MLRFSGKRPNGSKLDGAASLDELLGELIELFDLAGKADPRARLLLHEAQEGLLLLLALVLDGLARSGNALGEEEELREILSADTEALAKI